MANKLNKIFQFLKKISGKIYKFGKWILVETIIDIKWIIEKAFKYRWWIILAFIIGSVIVTVVNLFRIIYFYKSLINYFASNLGLNIWLINIIAVVFTIVIIISLRWIWKIILPSPFIKSHERLQATLGVAGLFIFFCLIMWYLAKDDYFDTSGAPQKCYAATIDGYEYVDCRYKLHRIYGTIVKPVTPEIVWILENKNISKVRRLVPDKNTRFFSPDGRSLAYYYKYPNGKLEFFFEPGSHPQLGEVLLPISSKIVKLLFEYLESGKDSMIVGNEIRKYFSLSNNDINLEIKKTTPKDSVIFDNRIREYSSPSNYDVNSDTKKEIIADYIINHSFINTTQAKEIIITLLDNGDSFNQTLSQGVASLFSSKGFNSTTSFFSTNFIDDGIFNKLYNGNSDIIRNLKLIKYSDFLCIGKLSISYRDSKIRSDMITANYKVDIRVISLENSKIHQHFNKSVTGIGWSNEEASSIARGKILSIIEDNFYNWSEL